MVFDMAINQRLWTKEEEQILAELYKKGVLVADIAKQLGRTRSSVIQKAMRTPDLKHKKYYTDEEKEYIDKYIGRMSVQKMAKKLNKKYESLKVYITDNYGSVRDNAQGLTCADVARILGVDRNTVLHWCKQKGLKNRKVGRYRIVNEKDLFSFLEQNQKIWDATKCESWFFQSCDWFNKKRKKDFDAMVNKRWGSVS